MKALVTTLLGLLLMVFAPVANAQEEEDFISRLGLNVSAGGGVADFTGEQMRDITGTGGAWDARAVLGTRQLIGVELGYLGSIQTIDTLGLDTEAMLLSTGVDAAVRVHILPGALQPYAFVGAGWRRYDLANADTNTSSVRESDNVFEVPMGIGVAYTYGHMLFDVRGAFRPSFDSDLIPVKEASEPMPNVDTVDMNTFQVTARIGWEF